MLCCNRTMAEYDHDAVNGIDRRTPLGEDCGKSDKEVIVEEVWTSDDGINVFDQVELECQHRTISIPLHIKDDDNNVGTRLEIRSMAKKDLTPLDMHYNSIMSSKATPSSTNHMENHEQVDNNQPVERDDEFYDGTGHLVWLASISFGQLLTISDSPLRQYFDHKYVCELGSGTGAAGVTTLLVCNPSHVVFTDNDQDALDLCQTNCRLNLPSHTYTGTCGDDDPPIRPANHSFELFAWGQELKPRAMEECGRSEGETTANAARSTRMISESFDTVLATDVVYDIKMVPPLLQSASRLLKPRTGILVLSHVPRFCLPRQHRAVGAGGEEDDIISATTTSSNNEHTRNSDPHLNLEDFIQCQAQAVGFEVVDTIRPSELFRERRSSSKATGNDASSFKNMKHQNDKDSYGVDDGHSQKIIVEELIVSTQDLDDAHAIIFVFRLSDEAE